MYYYSFLLLLEILWKKRTVKSKKADAQVTFYSRGSYVIVMFKQLSQFQMSKLFILNAVADVLSGKCYSMI